jgi:lipoyl(octanoyl) transferase 2
MRLPSIGISSFRHSLSHGARRMSSQPAASGAGGLKLLLHNHLAGDGGDGGILSYDEADTVQEDARAGFLAWKSFPDPDETEHPIACPRPRLFSFESTPTFTLGRRQDGPAPDQIDRLQRPLTVDLPSRRAPVRDRVFVPQVRTTKRGGLTTYHGPGQLVLWPVLDMRSPLHARYSVESYASHLESTTRRLLAELYGIRTYTNRDEPGVWVAAAGGAPSEERKIAALGVHHRRHVTALGIALNVDVPVVGGEDVNPWARFVPCGLEGRAVTSIANEAASGSNNQWDLPGLANAWASMFEEGLLDASKRPFD